MDVLILGAGIAGLGAAKALLKSGKTFAVLEAQSNAGGRINTLPMEAFGGSPTKGPRVDAGAQWLHGKQNELYDIAMRNDLLRDELSEEGLGTYLRDDGYRIDDYLVKKVDFFIGQVLEECESFAIEGSKPFPSSVDAFIREQFEKKSKELYDDGEQDLARQLLDWHIRFQIIDNSCLSLKEVSAKLWGKYSFNGESCQAHINMKNGFIELVDCLINDIGQDKILCNKEVNEIRWKDLNSRILVKCTDGTMYSCKNLIVTFSLGVLKATLSKLFHPTLPKSYRRSILNIGFGTINKIFLQFDNAWWGTTKGFQLIWKDNFGKDSHWTRYLSGFDVVFPGPSNTLLGWVGGYGALEMEKLSDKQIVSDCIFVLQKAARKKVPPPTFFLCTRWNSNIYIRGSYSYTSVHCDYEPDFLDALTESLVCDKYDKVSGELCSGTTPISTEKSASIHFAGEACQDKYFSTVHGAFLSGLEQAKKIF
ncbi:spermine oxidase-like isoform X3 [Malaya genurostris]|nr:spermine oxidase-like isoform X3 [Malaya genurostris]